jgi:hypothetical protein
MNINNNAIINIIARVKVVFQFNPRNMCVAVLRQSLHVHIYIWFKEYNALCEGEMTMV